MSKPKLTKSCRAERRRRRISRRWDVDIWTGLGWPRIKTVGVRL